MKINEKKVYENININIMKNTDMNIFHIFKIYEIINRRRILKIQMVTKWTISS